MNMNKKEKPRRSLNQMLDQELANIENTPLAGVTGSSEPTSSSVSSAEPSPIKKKGGGEAIPTKKATTIMPKELFRALQNYCDDNDLPKHRAICRFILDGLHRAGQLNDKDYQRVKGLADKITTTYEKK